MGPFDKITVDITVSLGAALVPIHQLLRMGRGAVIELDSRAQDEVAILANNVPIARGQVLLQGERVAVSVTEILRRDPHTRS